MNYAKYKATTCKVYPKLFKWKMCHVHICKPFGIEIFKDVLLGYIETLKK
jgi:hypothetical protein